MTMQQKQKYFVPEMAYQDEVSECGLACIVMLANMLGHSVSLDVLRCRYAVSTAGMSLNEIVNVLAEFDVQAIPVTFPKESLSTLPLPAILHYGGNHFVLATDRVGNYIKIMNPATGEGVFSVDKLHEILTGFAIILEPDQRVVTEENLFEKPGQEIGRGFLLANLTLPNMKKIFLFSVLSVFFGLLIPALFLLALGGGKQDFVGNEANVFRLCMVVGVAVLISAATELLLTKLQIVTATTVSLQYMPSMFASLLRKKYHFFEKRQLADIEQRFSSISQAMTGRAALLTSMRISFITSFLAVVVMFWIHVLLGCLAVAVISIYGLVSIYYAQPRTALIKLFEEANASKNELIFETINGIGTVKSAQMHIERCDKLARRHVYGININNQLQMMEAKQRVLYSSVANIEAVILLAISVILFARQELSVGALFSFTLFKQIASSSATTFYMACITYKTQSVVDVRAQTMMTYPEDKQSVAEVAFSHRLVLSDVCFAYEQSSVLYPNLAFSITSGEKIAIIGTSGCGKSTLLKLLSGLYSPSFGSVLVDNQPVHWDVLSSLTCYLQQHDILFNATIQDNITLFKHTDTVKIESVVSALGLSSCIEQLPHGWNTMISETNPLMSSGQRQRVLIARTLCSEKKILMFDEPTANLDNKTAQLVMDAILGCEKAALVVLHDTELLTGFDRVMTIVDGELVNLESTYGVNSSKSRRGQDHECRVSARVK